MARKKAAKKTSTSVKKKRVSRKKTVKKTVKAANLKPWKKGQSGNPSGRPKGSKGFRTLLREIGQRPLPKALRKIHTMAKRLGIPEEDLTMNMALSLNMFRMALDKDSLRAQESIIDYVEGRPTQRVEQKIHNENPVVNVDLSIEDVRNMHKDDTQIIEEFQRRLT